jgi:oxygen-independent coproporphyrinogen-3 oxidase
MPAGVYLHIPFCKSRCSYCDFATDVYRSGEAVERYVHAICNEIDAFASSNPKSEIQNPKSIDTVYFGGGTPSLLSPSQIDTILKVVREKFDVANDVEITMEMNPATVTIESLDGYRSVGVNRASFGVQTFDDRALKLLARGHDANDARTTFELLRKAGFTNISFDLIAGLPGQTLEDWQKNVREAVAMKPEHLSLYLLEVHEATPLAEQIRSGRQPKPDDELAAAMYEFMVEELTAAGYRQYEISNFALPGFESRHNSKYWRLDPVYAFGVSAHSFDGSERYANDRDTARYVEKIESEATAEVMREKIDVASEYAFLGLRLADGLDLDDYRRKFGIDLEEKYSDELDQARANGLIEFNAGHIVLTERGKVFSNEVFSIFV